MVVGDVVNQLNPVVSATLTFQPAAGVEVMVSTIGVVGGIFYLTNGVNNGYLSVASSGQTATSVNVKMFINNTNYLHIALSGGYYNNFTGLQIK